MYTDFKVYSESSKVTLVVVSKTQSTDAILSVYNAGQRLFAENRVQELVSKYEILPKDIKWHLIGHLQKNKVKYIAPFVDWIHSVDSWELLSIIHNEAVKNNRIIKVLLQFHIAQESSKYGLTIDEGDIISQNVVNSNWSHIQICGVMGMATFTDDEELVRNEFRSLKQIFDHLKSKYFPDSTSFKEISMGMSSDYKIAVEEGATIIRIGSAVFR